MGVNRSPPSQRSGNQHKRGILTGTSCMGTSIITRSCHQSLGGQDYSSGWMRRPSTGTRKGTQLYIEHLRAMRTSAASTLASTRSPGSKISPKKSGASCRRRYHCFTHGPRFMTDNIFTADEIDLAEVLRVHTACEPFPRPDCASCLPKGGANRSTDNDQVGINKASESQETLGRRAAGRSAEGFQSRRRGMMTVFVIRSVK